MGAAVSWHQDGVTHWDSEDFNEDIHGFNFMAQIYDKWCVGLKVGKIDIKQLVSGSERLNGAVPMICNPMLSCAIDGSFPNCGYEKRITVNFDFIKENPY